MRTGPNRRPMLERDPELEAVVIALEAAAAGSGRLLLVEGAAGLGKSELLAAARRQAKSAGLGCLAARGGEFERDVAFGVARELFGRPRQVSSPADAHGFYWLLANFAEDTAQLVSVDDAQWADPASLRFLLYLAERLEGLPVALMVALRPEDSAAGGPELARLRSLPHARVLRLQPLSSTATAAVTRSSFPDAADEFCRAVFDASGGNPFLVREIVAALDLDGVTPTAAGAAGVVGLAPESVVRATATRLDQLRPEARAVAEAAAVLGTEAHLHLVARLAEVDPVVTAAAAHELTAAGILTAVSTRAGEPLHFAHPPVRSAVCDQIPAARRSALHARAAALLIEGDAAPERVAAHLLQCDPVGDQRVVEVLQAAADRAMALGAPESAVRYLERALAEPPPPADRAGLLVDIGCVRAIVGDPQAVEHLCRAVGLLADPSARAEALYEVGRALVHNGRYQEAIDALRRGLEEAGGSPSEVRRRLLAALLQATRLVPGSREIDLVDTARAEATPPAGDEPGLGALLGELSFERLMAGEPSHHVRSTAERALAGLGGGAYGRDGLPFYDAVAALTWADGLDAAKAALDQALADAERCGRPMAVATACFRRAVVSYLQGSIPAAVTDAQRAVDAGAQGWATYLPAARATLALALLERGELPRAAAVLESGDAPGAGTASASLPDAYLLVARATLHLAEGSAADTRRDALAAGRIVGDEVGAFTPSVQWRVPAALASHRLGESAEARRLAAEGVELTRRFGAPRTLGAALRVQGVVEGGAVGIARLREAVEVLAPSPARLEHARALADLGEALRSAGLAEAEDVLRQGLDAAERCGATAIAQRVRRALQAAGARVPRRRHHDPAALTPTEERVADLVAGGLSNRDVAQQLFVSVRAVEFHLGNVYTKLGIASRRQLAAALARRNRPRTD